MPRNALRHDAPVTGLLEPHVGFPDGGRRLVH